MVYLDYVTTKPGVFKIGTLIIGVIVLGVGCHSFFTSSWSKNYTEIAAACNHRDEIKPVEEWQQSCPDTIGMEKFFIGIVLALFVFSFAHFLQLIFLKETTEHYFKTFDIVYHILGGILLIIGGALYIYSAVQVKKLDDLLSVHIVGGSELQFYEEKIVAGVGALVNGLFYIATGILTYLSDLSREKD